MASSNEGFIHTRVPDPHNYIVCGGCGAVMPNRENVKCFQCDYDNGFVFRETTHCVTFDVVYEDEWNGVVLHPENATPVGPPWLSG